jgi:hypothetical protein
MANTKVSSEQIIDGLALGGNPTAATQTAGNNSTRIATTAYTDAAVTALIGGAPSTLDTLNEIAAAVSDDPDYVGTVNAALALKAPKASPTFTGVGQFDSYGGTSGKGRIQFGNSGQQFIEGMDTGNGGSGSYLKFGYGSTNALTITDTGNTGIGVNPTTKLHIAGPASSHTTLRIQSTTAGYDPTIVFASPTNASGIYLDDNDTNKLKIYTGYGKGVAGKEITIDNEARLGIGTSSPARELHVAKSANGGNAEIILENSFTNAGSSTDETTQIQGRFGGYDASYILTGKEGDYTTAALRKSYLAFWTRTATTGMTEKLRIDSSGRVLVNITGASGYGMLESTDLAITGQCILARTSGNVLVGQTSAGANGKLQVTGGISTTGNSEIRQSTNSDGSTLKFLGTQLVIGNTNANGYNYSGGGLIGSVSPSASQIMLDVGAVSTSGHRLKVINGADGVAGSLQYLSGSDVRFKVDSSSGNVNVGGVLELQSNNSGFPTTGMVLNQNNFVYLRGGSNGLIMGKAGDNEAMRINSGGNLLLNGNSDLDASHIAIHQHSNKNGITFKAPNTSSYMALQFQNNSGGRIGYIQYSNTATSYSTSSDYRLKENVVPMTGSIDRVKALKPSRFNFIVDADKTVDGFLAHEAQEIVPECATGTKDAMRDEEYEVTAAVEEVRDEDDNITTEAVEAVMGTRSVPDYQGIDQAKLVPLLVAALQEAIARIEILEG